MELLAVLILGGICYKLLRPLRLGWLGGGFLSLVLAAFVYQIIYQALVSPFHELARPAASADIPLVVPLVLFGLACAIGGFVIGRRVALWLHGRWD